MKFQFVPNFDRFKEISGKPIIKFESQTEVKTETFWVKLRWLELWAFTVSLSLPKLLTLFEIGLSSVTIAVSSIEEAMSLLQHTDFVSSNYVLYFCYI